MNTRRSEEDVDQALVSDFVAGQRPWRISRRHDRRLGPVLAISLWLHLTLLLLLMVTVHYAPTEEEELPPPSTVAMVFEGGQPQGPAVPKQQLLAPSAPSPAAPSPVPQTSPRAITQPPPAPPAPTPAPPVASASPAPAPRLPAPQPPPQANTEEPLPLPPPPPPLAMVMPRPALPPMPRPAQPAPAPSRPERAPAFPAPMNFSFNPAPSIAHPQPRTSSRAPQTLDFSLAPREGATDNTPFSRVAGAHVGPDWRNELSAWVHAHAYYPPQAAMNGEDGTAMVRVVANPDGHVTSVELESRSGSTWLDLALQALFRDAHLPPLHEDEPITFDFTMHYILIRTP